MYRRPKWKAQYRINNYLLFSSAGNKLDLEFYSTNNDFEDF